MAKIEEAFETNKVHTCLVSINMADSRKKKKRVPIGNVITYHHLNYISEIHLDDFQ